jgi:hypothetical protein
MGSRGRVLGRCHDRRHTQRLTRHRWRATLRAGTTPDTSAACALYHLNPFLLGFLGLQAGLDEIDEDPAGARLPRLGQGAHASGDIDWNRNALTNRPLSLGHQG